MRARAVAWLAVPGCVLLVLGARVDGWLGNCLFSGGFTLLAEGAYLAVTGRTFGQPKD